MNIKSFLQNIRYIGSNPDGIGQIREAILQLGVKGKLTEQFPSEATAIECIKQAEPPISYFEPETGVHLPNGWASVPLGGIIATNTGGGTPSKNNPDYWHGNIPWASVKDIKSDRYIDITIDSITEDGLQHSSSNLIPKNHLLVVTRMGLGKLAINKIPMAINQDLRAIKPTKALDLNYAYLLFKSLKFVGKGVTVKGISVRDLHAQAVWIPPFPDRIGGICGRLIPLSRPSARCAIERGKPRVVARAMPR